jgi:hypothetical protein
MKQIARVLLVLVPLGGFRGALPEDFAALHGLIQPQAGEFAWYEEIPWLTSVKEAVEKAAGEGKPILIWSSADGQPCGAT